MRYFITYYYRNKNQAFNSSVIDLIGNVITTIHPFDWLAEMLKIKHVDESYALINWYEISDHDVEKITGLVT